ncbi:MAG: ribosome maturation factor RimP [candidate division NC10 bacterium]|jgi:ribosome maturation factor RimP
MPTFSFVEAAVGRPDALLLERLRAVVDPVLRGEGCELVDLEYRREGPGWVLRILMDKPGGVALADCQRVSEQVGDLLDVEDLIPRAYTLEVSSPGLERPLTRPEDFVRFAGRAVRVSTFAPVDGQRHFAGTLRGCEGEAVLLELEGPRLVRIPQGVISRARLQFPG